MYIYIYIYIYYLRVVHHRVSALSLQVLRAVCNHAHTHFSLATLRAKYTHICTHTQNSYPGVVKSWFLWFCLSDHEHLSFCWLFFWVFSWLPCHLPPVAHFAGVGGLRENDQKSALYSSHRYLRLHLYLTYILHWIANCTPTAIIFLCCALCWYRVAKTDRMPYLYRTFPAKNPYN